MKKLLLTLAICAASLCGLLSLSSMSVFAEDACNMAGYKDPLVCGTQNSDEEEALMQRTRGVLNVVYLWIGIIAVVVIVIGGIRYMTSQGDAGKVQTSKRTIMGAVIGLVLTLSAFGITNLVIAALEGKTDVGEIETPPEKSREVVAIRVSTKVSILEGDSVTLHPSVVPDYAENRKLSFSSSNPKIATIDKKGKINAKSKGTTTVTTKAENGVKTDTEITVRELIKVQSIKFDKTEIKLKYGGSAQIKATVEPRNAADKTLTWTSSKPSYVSVTKTGIVRALAKEGEAVITATSSNGIKATATVKIISISHVDANLISHLDSHYTQGMFDGKPGSTISCGVFSGSCGQAAMLGAYYFLTRKDTDYVTFARMSNSLDIFGWPGDCSGSALSKYVTSSNAANQLSSRYGIHVRFVALSYDAIVGELKKGHPVVLLAGGAGPAGGGRNIYRYTNPNDGGHYVTALDYRSSDGAIYVWNPSSGYRNCGSYNTKASGSCGQGWISKEAFIGQFNVSVSGQQLAVYKN